MKKNNKKDTGWGTVAVWYNTLIRGNDTYQKEVILPHLLRLVAPKSGKRIADIGCGQGFFSFAFAESGATVTGFDIAKELTALATTHAKEHSKLNVAFYTAPANQLPARDNAFDTALFVLSLQNIEEYREAVAESARVLKQGGELFIVLNHPAFRIPTSSSWEFDEATKTQYRRVDRYALPFSTKIDMTPGTADSKKKIYTLSFHRSLQDYVKAVTKAGLVVTGLEEWHSHRTSQKGPRAEAEDAARKEFPLFLMLRAQKQ
ncbi:MAG: class I SAM-dependent methyltransferase [Patescibacteria group bacterium]